MCSKIPPIDFSKLDTGCGSEPPNKLTFPPNLKVLRNGVYFGNVISHNIDKRRFLIKDMTQNKYSGGKVLAYNY